MVLKSNSIIPFMFKGTKKLIAISSIGGNIELHLNDVQHAICSSFENLKHKFEFYNFKIGFHIPEEIFIPYLEQRHDLTNFIIEIVETDQKEVNDLSNQRTNVQRSEESARPLKRAGSDIPLVQIKQMKCDDYFNVDKHLQNILESSTEGQAICRHFKSSNQLREEDRAALVELITNFAFENVIDSEKPFAIDSKTLMAWAAAIVFKFPGEDPSKYFNDEGLTSFKHIAGGNLFELFLEKKAQYIKNMDTDYKYFNLDQEAIDADFLEFVELRTFTGEWKSYFKAWRYTFGLRNIYFLCSPNPMYLFEKLISTVRDRTHDLVNYDFERLHPKKSNSLFDNWNNVSEKMFTEALCMGRNDVPLIMDLYGNLSELSGLMMLSYFVENYEGDVRPFEKDHPENLVIHIESINGDLQHFFNDYVNTNGTLTPVIIAIGTVEAALTFYVLVGPSFFKMETVLKAVDFCFKCYHVLQLPDRGDQSLSWKIIQSAFYDIPIHNGCMASEKILKSLRNL